MALLQKSIVAGLALSLSATALADDPRDPTMQTPEALAHDREMIRRLNADMLAQVTARDARFADGWLAHRQYREGRHPAQVAYERDHARYTENRRRYEQAMAEWREDVRDCRAGNSEACR